MGTTQTRMDKMINFKHMKDVKRITFYCPICAVEYNMPESLKTNVLINHYSVEHPNMRYQP